MIYLGAGGEPHNKTKRVKHSHNMYMCVCVYTLSKVLPWALLYVCCVCMFYDFLLGYKIIMQNNVSHYILYIILY